MARVQLKHVYKRYTADVATVKDFNLDIADREFLVLVGPSGCGKSTTLRMIAGLEEITEGELLIGDRLVNDVHPKDRDIAMVFQNYALYPHMSIYENMAFGLKLRKVSKAEIDKRVRDAAKILDIEHLLDRKPKALSGGQRQRVALGRAIVREPQVFLMDEPLSNLDAKLRVQMRAEIAKLHQRLQTTVIYVTHDQTEAMTMGDRIVVMKDGLIQQVGTPQEIYNHPNNVFVASFIGSPSMNFLRGNLVEEGGALFFRAEGANVRLPEGRYAALREAGVVGKEVILGIRPENVHDEPMVLDTFPDSTVQADVEVVELLGAESYVYLNLAGQSLVARVAARSEIKPLTKVSLALDINKIHVFHADTEQAIF
ncbi:sn-glycerol-3-phosphate ABC transporter ATP-binding protein UgpC [Tumebacillus sp. DT12]|uniref:Sn-glycerol-3-phosphate ABC transporter ATP-binding protein UgpC n=1 Tax=Tumebacillus lacus TaxID=2995335 RepID=A0ABT3X5C7_9BACL|nr:sn-glycerol-3-phosphate ABC transporter ATP-binding protein UgpC [Tumebacillus lacus]MCX7571167.1 sn-glycerol-3-phosphate ABC transporter ATP-binding protein UgpC [Tumebacillus lacus]